MNIKADVNGCEECLMGSPTYVPCNKPAIVLVWWPKRNEGPYRMCEMCADHNVKNRGAEIKEILSKPIVTISAEQIVSRYLELRTFKKAEADSFAEKMKPYNDAMEALERAAVELMQATGQKALSAKSGTAYQSHTISLTCENPTEFLDWVFQHNARQFLTAHVNKDAVKEFMDGPGEGHPPPGVKVQPVVNVNFRKA